MLSLSRHKKVDSDSCKDDQELNKAAVISGGRIFSSYNVPSELLDIADSDKVWIITEGEDKDAVRKCTTLLYPSEYWYIGA